MYKIPCLLLLLTAVPAQAISEYDLTIGVLGAQGNNVYFETIEDRSVTCLHQKLYIDITSDFGKSAHSNLLFAKSTSRKLSRVDYDQTSEGQCVVALIEVED
ncbi:hypothetical protein [Microbulbifer sp. TYP-18]|uniref:hypothetical protein n=1 Tax=Microbulbifer sp. TYP-18 TaxID=3230024 RepID=UPI0034C6498A